MASCRKIRRALARSEPWGEGRLSLEEELLIDEHLGACEPCRGLARASRALDEALLELPRTEVGRADVERSLEAIHAALEARAGSRTESRTGTRDRGAFGSRIAGTFRGPRAASAIGAAAAAAVLAVALGWILWPRSASSPATSPETSPLASPEEPERKSTPSAPSSPSSAPVRRGWLPLGPTDLDRDRLESARRELQDALAAARESSGLALDEAGGASAFVAAVEERTRALSAAGWPLRRMSEGLLTGSDADSARAAARYLGLRGDELSLRALAQALGRPERREAAFAALRDAGERALDPLVSAFWESEPSEPADLAARIVRHVASLGAQPARAFVERALARTPARMDRDEARRRARELPDLLGGASAESARALLALGGHSLFDRGAVLDAYERHPLGQATLAELLSDTGSSALDPALVLEAVRRLDPPGALDWTLARVEEGGPAAERAFAVLAGLADERALETMLALRRAVSEESYLAGLRRSIEADPARLEAEAQRALSSADRTRIQDLLELCVATESSGAVPAIVALAGSSALGDDARERALLAAGELGTSEHLSELERAFGAFVPKERGVAAACVFATWQLAGAEGLERLLSDADLRRLETVRALLEHPSPRAGRAVTLFKLAGALDPLLASAERQNRRFSP